MNEIILAMMVWISSVTGLNVPEIPSFPPSYVTESRLKYLMNGCSEELNTERCHAITSEKDTDSILGVYDHKTKRIYLNIATFSWENEVQNSILVHELVHHMQFANNIPYKCLGELEELAYDVQNKWLLENGKRDVYKELDISPLWILVIKACNTSWGAPPD